MCLFDSASRVASRSHDSAPRPSPSPLAPRNPALPAPRAVPAVPPEARLASRLRAPSGAPRSAPRPAGAPGRPEAGPRSWQIGGGGGPGRVRSRRLEMHRNHRIRSLPHTSRGATRHGRRSAVKAGVDAGSNRRANTSESLSTAPSCPHARRRPGVRRAQPYNPLRARVWPSSIVWPGVSAHTSHRTSR